MSDGHCFISYSHADGLDFVTKLADELEGGHPFIRVWFEKREMVAGRDDWDDQLAKAIQTCKCLLFVMSKDSTGGNSNCKAEWTWALKYKKPVICLWIDKDAEDQFRLNSRQKIDFTANFDQGLARLRKSIAHLDSPEGELEELRHRLADANRDLHRAMEEEKPRIQAEIDQLKADIQALEKVVANPQAAAKQTQKNIETGLERERKPELPLAGVQSTKFINPPPGIAPNYFQDRAVETKQVFDFLQDDAQRLMTIVGRGGVGKTAMICRLLKHLENSAIPEDLQKAFSGIQPLKVDGIVYLSESGSHRVNFTNIFYDLCKLLPKESAQKLDAVYKNPQGSTESKMRHLLEQFTGERVVLLLDNFEPLVDAETFEIHDTELNEALLAFLNGTHTSVNIIITTRIAPKKLNLVQPGRQRPLDLDDGLESPYAENILREMDSDGRLGLQSASDESLKQAKEKTRGFPKALEALFAILASDRYTTLDELLAMPTPVNVVEALVGEAFNRLDTNAQKVMQALAVYNRPVTPAAVDYLLAPHIPAMDSAPILQRLANMHFARKESGRFYLHPVDREFAFGLIPEKDSNTKDTKDSKEEQRKLLESAFSKRQFSFPNYHLLFTRHDLTLRAADYFAAARKPRAEWKKLDDLAAQLAEFELRCEAGDYDTAASVLFKIDFDYLLLWGHYRLLIDLHMRLKDKIKDNYLRLSNFNGLGSSHYSIGKVKESIEYFQLGLDSAQEAKNRDWESAFLGNLGIAYAALGSPRKSIEFHQQQLAICKEIGNRKSEGVALGSLGNRYAALGDMLKAIEFYEQALVIARETHDRITEGGNLGNLGICYACLGEARKAIEFHHQALVISREIDDRNGEASKLGNIGLTLLSINKYEEATENFILSIEIADEISYPIVQNEERWGLAQAYLFQNDLINARATIEAALQYDMPMYNHNASALHGIIALRQGERKTAQEAFTKSIAQADEILAKTPDYYSALDAKGLALVGAGLIRHMNESSGKDARQDETKVSKERPARTQEIEQAIETFRKARKIAPHAGVVKSVLRLFDELAKCEGGEILKDVRSVVEGS